MVLYCTQNIIKKLVVRAWKIFFSKTNIRFISQIFESVYLIIDFYLSFAADISSAQQFINRRLMILPLWNLPFQQLTGTERRTKISRYSENVNKDDDNEKIACDSISHR